MAIIRDENCIQSHLSLTGHAVRLYCARGFLVDQPFSNATLYLNWLASKRPFNEYRDEIIRKTLNFT